MSRAVRFDRYGGIDVLQVVDVEVGHPAPDEYLVAVRATGINPGEASIRQGFLDAVFPATFPSGQGSDFAGVVTEAGEKTTSFAVGDEVLGWTDRRAAQAEHVIVPEDHLIRKPRDLSWEAAGSLPIVAFTAYAAVRAVSAGPGETVVVSAAAGGVGSIASQLLKVNGAEVIGIASEANHGWLDSVGVTPVAYGDGLLERVRAAAPDGVNALIDTFGAEYVRLAVELGVAPERIETVIVFDAAKKLDAKSDGSSTAANTKVLAEMAELVASGKIEMSIAATYGLDQVHAAYTELEKRHTRGKIVLIP